jgi:2-(1,2-epoxy-1,2-dihydrophenyl)acetyl-CoA isomerase
MAAIDADAGKSDVEREAPGVHTHVDKHVLVLTLSRPAKRNALRHEEVAELVSAVESAADADDVRAILLRAEGDTFCAGADLVALGAAGGKPRIGHMVRALERGAHRLIEALWNCRVPTISAVQGRALGLGLHLAVVCDFVLASADAEFRAPFRDRGFCVDSGGSFLLPHLVGPRRARQMLLRGVGVDATTAVQWGLIDTAVKRCDLDSAAFEQAAELASGPTFALGHTKALLNHRSPRDLSAALRAEADGVEATIRSTDFKEGLLAFAERRQPVFTGH